MNPALGFSESSHRSSVAPPDFRRAGNQFFRISGSVLAHSRDSLIG